MADSVASGPATSAADCGAGGVTVGQLPEYPLAAFAQVQLRIHTRSVNAVFDNRSPVSTG